MTSSPAQPEQINWNMLFCILFFWYCAVVKTEKVISDLNIFEHLH